jgi:hypothetical protein
MILYFITFNPFLLNIKKLIFLSFLGGLFLLYIGFYYIWLIGAFYSKDFEVFVIRVLRLLGLPSQVVKS